jgi:NAD(P)-dependent dehydrogenase (short-subunit alcohol dehydrogenase family)
MTSKLAGRVALVTGGSAGIGLGIAKHLAQEGARVFITGRRQSELDKAIAAIGGSAAAMRGDTSNLADLDHTYATIKAQAGHIDVLAVNAGVYEFGTFGEITEEHFDKTFNTNVRGLLFAVQKALPLLVRGSSVILTGSIASIKGFPPLGVQCVKGRGAIIRAQLDRRPQGARHPHQRVEPRACRDPRALQSDD